jgi:ABC-type bacteriocin/lantibiotic exporter with double-glycine peptidase domain
LISAVEEIVERKIDTILPSLIITKILKLSPKEIDRFGQEKLISLLGNRFKITRFLVKITDLCYQPLQALVSLLMIINEAGSMLVVSIGYSLLTKKEESARKEDEKHNKAAFKKLSDIAKGIKPIKTNALEERAWDKCTKEFKAAQDCRRRWSLYEELDWGQKELASNFVILTVVLGILWNNKEGLSLSKVYVIIMLHNSLRWSFFSIRKRWTDYVNTKIYFKEFFGMEEKPNVIENKEDPNGLIQFTNAQTACTVVQENCVGKEGEEHRVLFK